MPRCYDVRVRQWLIAEPLSCKPRMLNLERRTKILELLEKHGQVAVVELSKRFKTSEVTIRNDLKDLPRSRSGPSRTWWRREGSDREYGSFT
jgi:predicted HTH transcriptional regulator